MKITASLVLYNNSSDVYNESILSFLNGSDGILYILDNSEFPLTNHLFTNNRIKYIHAGKNLGFGNAHNKLFFEYCVSSDVHLIMNPDVYFDQHVIGSVLNYFHSNPDVGVLMPKISYFDGQIQNLCKLLPTPLDLFLRRFSPSFVLSFFKSKYVLSFISQEKVSDVPSLSGCFLFVRSECFKYLKGFDNRFFMYLEDVDLVRRLGMHTRVVYYPFVNVYHGYAKGSYKNFKLLFYHIVSTIKYFNKWGWIFDQYRSIVNKKFLCANKSDSA